MIDSNKLLPNRGTTITLSKGSVKKVALIERKLILIDSLLKEKLILSKVREGIRREEEERLKRTQQEIDLEKEEDDKDDPDAETKRRRKPKDPKDGGGVSLVGSALIGAGGVALAKNAGLIIGAAKVATILIGGTLFAGVQIAKAAKSIDNIKSQVAQFGPGGAAALKTAGLFTQVLSNFIGASIAVGIFNSLPSNLTGLKLRKRLGQRIKNLFKKKSAALATTTSTDITKVKVKNIFDEVKGDIAKSKVTSSGSRSRNFTKGFGVDPRDFGSNLRDDVIFSRRGFSTTSRKNLDRRRLFTRRTSVTRGGFDDVTGGGGRGPFGQGPFISGSRRQPINVTDFFDADFEPVIEFSGDKTSRVFTFRPNNRDLPDELKGTTFKSSGGISMDLEKIIKDADVKRINVETFSQRGKFLREIGQQEELNLGKIVRVDPNVDLGLLEDALAGATPEEIDAKILSDRAKRLRKTKEFVQPELDLFSGRKITKKLTELRQGVIPGLENVDLPLFNIPKKNMGGGDPFGNVKRSQFFDPMNPRASVVGGGFADSFFDTRSAKTVNQIVKNADNIVNVKSFSDLLEAFGGIPLVKASRKFIGNTIGRIPLLGDLLGLLLDIFVFKEPVGRAVFMAAGGALGGTIGAWLGGILGTAVPVVGNLAGAVVGGFLGGVGGDMLGGFLYDQIVGKQQKPQPLTEKAIKSTTKLALNGGGLVPSLAMQGGGETPNIASFASYDNPRSKVTTRFIPIPSTEKDESTDAFPVVLNKRVASRYEMQYKGGLG